MALFNYATKEITLKVVYYGPGLSGKTTNLQYLHSTMNPERRGKLLSLSTEADRTLFFDFLPIDIGKIKDFSIRFQLYTVPGQVRYNATRKLVLKGADAVVFVADSQREMREQNIESFQNMKENLIANNIDPDDIPIVLQYNKRDLSNILSVEELNSDLNTGYYQFVCAEAVNGKGVNETFQLITKLMLEHISKKHRVDIVPLREEEKPPEEEYILERPGVEEEVIKISVPEKEELLEEEEAIPPVEEKAEAVEEPLKEERVEITEFEKAAITEEVLEEEIPEAEKPKPEALEKEVAYDIEKIETLLNNLTEISHDVHSAVSDILLDFKDIREDIKSSRVEAMLENLASVSDSMKATVSELLKEVKESKRQQDEILKLLRNIDRIIAQASEEKKGLFRRLFGK
jgi:hypothetical protein